MNKEENDNKLDENCANEFECGPIKVRMEFAEQGKSIQDTLTDFLINCQKEVVVNG